MTATPARSKLSDRARIRLAQGTAEPQPADPVRPRLGVRFGARQPVRLLQLVSAITIAVVGTVSGVLLGIPVTEIQETAVALVALAVGGNRLSRNPQSVDGGPTWGSWVVATFGALGLLTVLEAVSSQQVSTSAVLVIVMSGAAVVPVRWLFRRSAHRPARVVVLGSPRDIGQVAALDHSGSIRTLAALVRVESGSTLEDGDSDDLGSLADTPFHVETYSSLAQVAGRVSVFAADAVIVFGSAGLSDVELRELTWMLERRRCRLLLATLPWGTSRHRVRVAEAGPMTLVEVASSRPSRVQRALKAAMDRTVGSLILLAAVPVLAVCALLIRLESPGSPFYRQQRVGREGVPFTMFKLRTMYVDAEERRAALEALNEGSGPLFKMKRDPRVTRIGRVLRKLSLDELPQLINVIRGEMALVGPRPALAREVAEYDDLMWRRLAVRPGMTGLWQVSGRSDLSHDESRRLDLEYVDNWTVRGDLAIAARTVKAVVSADGAY